MKHELVKIRGKRRTLTVKFGSKDSSKTTVTDDN